MAQRRDLVETIVRAIDERGPLPSSAFEGPREGGSSPWASWYGKESRRALEVLWSMGTLMVDHRRGGQKVYNLRERVLPPHLHADEAVPPPDERTRFFALRSARALGIVTPSWLADYFRRGWSRRESAALLEGLAAEGLLVPAAVEGLAEPAFLPVELQEAAAALARGDLTAGHTTLLSPFDNLIWHRARARALFGFEYVFEAYVRPDKRRYGYYSLALLHDGRLLGHLDPKLERRERRLLVRDLHLDVAAPATLPAALAGTLLRLARFLGADHVEVAGESARGARDLLAEVRDLLAGGGPLTR